MSKHVLSLFVLLTVGFMSLPQTVSAAYNFGDNRSTTLVGKAWEALENKDIEAVLAYTNKCIELYTNQAKKMQESLKDYPVGSNQDIFNFWALNDLATAYFIQGEAFRRAGMDDEAKEAFNKVIKEFKYGQCWDAKGWFWKPAEAAQEKLAMLESGSSLDFGDYTSTFLAGKAWDSLSKGDLDGVLAYTNKCLELYETKAQEMQESLTEYPWESKDKIFSYWALNDVGTCLFIQAQGYQGAGKTKEAMGTYRKLVDNFYFAQCWDPNGWFWKPAEVAQQKLDEMGEG